MSSGFQGTNLLISRCGAVKTKQSTQHCDKLVRQLKEASEAEATCCAHYIKNVSRHTSGILIPNRETPMTGGHGRPNDLAGSLREVGNLSLELLDGSLELGGTITLLLDDLGSRLGNEALVSKGASDPRELTLGLGELTLETNRLGCQIHEPAEDDEDLERTIGYGDRVERLLLLGAERKLVDATHGADEAPLTLENGDILLRRTHGHVKFGLG